MSCRAVLPGRRLAEALRPRSCEEREDASHRLLQPIDETSTREPSDSRLEALASRTVAAYPRSLGAETALRHLDFG